MNWHFEDTGVASGTLNMEYDERLGREVAEGKRSSTFRVYGWNPSAISLGWNQSLDEIDGELARSEGIDIVRRPTGGRAILHSDELTYSVTMLSEGKSVGTVYREISRALASGLQLLGVEASVEKSQPDFPSLYSTPSAAACFTSSARHEIKVDGRKLVGSAQRRFVFHGTEVVLQHGSILLGSGHQRIVDFLNLHDESERGRIKEELKIKTTDLRSILGSTVPFSEVAEAVRTGFEKAWEIAFDLPLSEYHSLVEL